MFRVERSEVEDFVRIGEVVVHTVTSTAAIRPAKVTRAAVEAWVRAKHTVSGEGDQAEYQFDEEPVGHWFHDDYADLVEAVVTQLEHRGVRVGR